MSSLNTISQHYIHRIIPNYPDTVVKLNFDNEASFIEWFNETAKKHANWIYKSAYTSTENGRFKGIPLAHPVPIRTVYYLCDHAGKPQPSKRRSEIKRQKKHPSIKVGCPAKISKQTMNDDSIVVAYRWSHPNHDPTDFNEIARSRLPNNVRQWIENCVDQDMDWKSIKHLLCLEQTTIEKNGNCIAFPTSLLVNYQTVQNIIQSRVNKQTRMSIQ